ALATQVEDKALLGTMTAGGVDKDKAIKAPLASSKTDAAIWGVVNKAQDLDQLHAKMTMGYGSADVKNGTITTDLHLVLDSAKAATDGAAQATQQLAAPRRAARSRPRSPVCSARSPSRRSGPRWWCRRRSPRRTCSGSSRSSRWVRA